MRQMYQGQGKIGLISANKELLLLLSTDQQLLSSLRKQMRVDNFLDLCSKEELRNALERKQQREDELYRMHREEQLGSAPESRANVLDMSMKELYKNCYNLKLIPYEPNKDEYRRKLNSIHRSEYANLLVNNFPHMFVKSISKHYNRADEINFEFGMENNAQSQALQSFLYQNEQNDGNEQINENEQDHQNDQNIQNQQNDENDEDDQSAQNSSLNGFVVSDSEIEEVSSYSEISEVGRKTKKIRKLRKPTKTRNKKRKMNLDSDEDEDAQQQEQREEKEEEDIGEELYMEESEQGNEQESEQESVQESEKENKQPQRRLTHISKMCIDYD